MARFISLRAGGGGVLHVSVDLTRRFPLPGELLDVGHSKNANPMDGPTKYGQFVAIGE
jgi:hypothetical protein